MKRIGNIDGRRIKGFIFRDTANVEAVGLENEVVYQPATDGVGEPVGIRGSVVLGAAASYKHDTVAGSMYGVMGRLKFLAGATLDQAYSVFAALRGRMEATGVPVFTAFNTLACLHLDNMCQTDMDGIGFEGSCLASMQNHGGKIDHGILIRGNNKLRNVFSLNSMDGTIGNGAHAGAAKNFRVLLEGDTFYINCYAAT